ncbi:MAG: ABC transporter permease [Candidatus Aminicenantaceae bacterium]
MMIAHYFKTTIRSISRTGLYSFINVLGLAVGMAACLLILHYVIFETSYDRFHTNSDRIYRLRYERTAEDGTAVRFASCTPPAADFIRGAYPEVESIARIWRHRAVVSLKDQGVKFTEDRMYFAESEFFEIFDFPFADGNPTQGIRDPSTAFISRSTARKYFGDVNPIGRTITVDGQTNYTITGQFEDIPSNSHLKFDIILSFENLRAIYGPDVMGSWGHTTFFTYILFKPGTDPRAFEEQMVSLVRKNCAELMDYYKLLIELKLQPLTDIHLTSHFMQEYETNGSRDSVNFLGLAALFIILMAWVNYVNLSTARALTRAREVGLRKVVGASRFQVSTQLLFETAAVNLIALVLAIALVQALLPGFSRLAGIPLSLSFWSRDWFWAAVPLLFLAGIFLSGTYPVSAISAFQPLRVIRGTLGSVPRGINLRKALVIFQFVIALVLLTSAFTVYRQILFMKSRNSGFDMEQILVVKAPRVRDEAFAQKFSTFKEELLREPGVRQMCVVTEVPGRQIFWDAGAILKAGEDQGKGKNYMIVGVDYEFVDVFKLDLLHGRNFSRDFPSDEMALILNETAVRWMGFTSSQEAVGQQVDYWGVIYNIIGVLSDYHQQSPKAAFEPTIYRLLPYGRGERGQFAVKIDGPDTKAIIAAVQDQYAEFFPGNPFEFFFLDDYYDQQFRADELFGKVMGIFSLLAVFVTGLGIFGVSAFMALQRTKEIGIRKVVGARAGSIVVLLCKEFILLIAVANVVAWPVAFFALRKWLQNFPYAVDLDLGVFAMTSALTLAIALLTVGVQSYKAASADPVTALRHE